MIESLVPWCEENRWTAGKSAEDALLEWYARSRGGVLLVAWPVGKGSLWPAQTRVRTIDALRVIFPAIGAAGVWKGIDAPSLLGDHPKLEAIEAKKKLSRSVIGQALVGARMLTRELPGASVVPVALCDEGDPGLQMVAVELGVRVVVRRSADAERDPLLG